MELWSIPGIYGERRLSREGKSFYRELNLAKGSNSRQIHYAHKSLVYKFQRQNSRDENEENGQKIKELNRIYGVLTDKKKRAIYDEYGSYGLHISEKYGDDDVFFQSVVTSLCCQIFGVVTCGYCCFCCFYCCDCCCGLLGERKKRPGANNQQQPSPESPQTSRVGEEGEGVLSASSTSSNISSSPSPSPTEEEPEVITVQPQKS